jgi:hypothetical protein
MMVVRPTASITSNPERRMTELLITGLHHDLSRKRSFAHFQWKNDPEKHLALDVPFDCTSDKSPKEARKALEALSEELALATVATPP